MSTLGTFTPVVGELEKRFLLKDELRQECHRSIEQLQEIAMTYPLGSSERDSIMSAVIVVAKLSDTIGEKL